MRQQLVDQLPWGHIVVLIYELESMDIRKFYILKTVENGWSRNVLVHQIESNLYERQGASKQLTNFSCATV